MRKGHSALPARLLGGMRGPGDCWEWVGYVTPDGHALMKFKGRTISIHRYVYEMWVGPVPDGLELDHLCRNRRCYNWRHLEPVTHAENLRRANEHRTPDTHCKRGHPLTAENTKRGRDGRRRCVTCARARKRESTRLWRERNPERAKEIARDSYYRTRDYALPRLYEQRRKRRGQKKSA